MKQVCIGVDVMIASAHIMEAIFKGLVKAIDQATMAEEWLAGKVLSTKGML